MQIPVDSPSSAPTQTPAFVKAFGERHCGTNLLERLILANSSSAILPGTTGPHRPIQFAISERLRGVRGARDAFVDLTSIGVKPVYTWKHSATNFPSTVAFRQAAVLFLVKHPLSWLVSMSRKPYHFPGNVPREPHRLAHTPVRTLGREGLKRDVMLPLEIWSAKVHSYLRWSEDLARDDVAHRVIRFEDLVSSQERTFDTIRSLVRQPSPNVTQIEASTKNSSRSRSDYAHYYTTQRWREHFTNPQATDLLSSIDPTLLSRFNYS